MKSVIVTIQKIQHSHSNRTYILSIKRPRERMPWRSERHEVSSTDKVNVSLYKAIARILNSWCDRCTLFFMRCVRSLSVVNVVKTRCSGGRRYTFHSVCCVLGIRMWWIEVSNVMCGWNCSCSNVLQNIYVRCGTVVKYQEFRRVCVNKAIPWTSVAVVKTRGLHCEVNMI